MGSGWVKGPEDSSKDPAEVGHNKKRIVGGVTVQTSPHDATYSMIWQKEKHLFLPYLCLVVWGLRWGPLGLQVCEIDPRPS